MLKKMLAVTVAFVTVITLIACVSAIRSNASARDTWCETRVVTTITVKPNKTLWSIAEEYKPSWMDTREYIHEIKTLNDMDTSFIDVGQTLQVYATMALVEITPNK